MRNFLLITLVLAIADICIATPVIIYETETVITTVRASENTASVEPALPARLPSPSSSNATTSVVINNGTSESNWGSILSSLLRPGKNSSNSVPVAVPAVAPPVPNTRIVSSVHVSVSTSGSSKTTARKLQSSTSSSSSSISTSTPTSASISKSGIYDAIYNSSEDIDINFSKAILDAHNSYRADHGVAPLAWAEGPYAYAKSIADNYDCSGDLAHTNTQYGENLAVGFATGRAAVASWYSEGETFDYTAMDQHNHFTQVIWKGSTQVGCAYKTCSANGWQLYVVCEYNPAGNFVGQEKANVLPPV